MYFNLKVRVNFQKKLLLVELSWMNDDAQQEVSILVTLNFYADLQLLHVNQ